MSTHPSWSLFGLTVRSHLPLPFAAMRGGDGSEPDVSVRFGTLSASSGRMEACGPDALQFEAPGAGRFRISAGRDIVVDPAPGASERNLRIYLLGSAFGALLHQRGLLPLHANAIVVDGQAIAFMGPSGSGKSTLAVWFQDRGHVTLADDVCAVAMHEGTPHVLPGVPRVRLWKDALERSGREPGLFEPSFDGRDKFDVPSPHAAAVRTPLAAVYLLEEGDVDLSIERLSPGKAIEALIANTYRGRCVQLLGAGARHFSACVALGQTIPVHCVKRRKDLASFEHTAQCLESHAREWLACTTDPQC
jgi:hypothetical protein